jgi:hypothetical protein
MQSISRPFDILIGNLMVDSLFTQPDEEIVATYLPTTAKMDIISKPIKNMFFFQYSLGQKSQGCQHGTNPTNMAISVFSIARKTSIYQERTPLNYKW